MIGRKVWPLASKETPDIESTRNFDKYLKLVKAKKLSAQVTALSRLWD